MPEQRQKRIRRGASSSVGPVAARNAPSVSPPPVVQQRGVVTSNPMRGATQAGNQFASRITQMGDDVNRFFGQLAGSADAAADMVQKETLVDIELENVRERQLAASDELTGKPINPQLSNDRDYFETRLKIKAGIAAVEASAEFNTKILPTLGVTDNHAQALATFTATKTQGMDPTYSTYYSSEIAKRSLPEIDKHISTLFTNENLNTQLELSTRIQGTFAGNPEHWDYNRIPALVAEAGNVLPKASTQAPGATKAWVLNQAMRSINQAPKPELAKLAFLNQLATNPELGDPVNKRTFAQMYPNQYQALAANLSKITNQQYKAQAKAVVSTLKELTVELANPLNNDSQGTALSMLSYLESPEVADFNNNDGVNSARSAAFAALGTYTDNRAAGVAVSNWLGGQGSLPQKTVTKFLENPGQAMLNITLAGKLLASPNISTTELDKAVMGVAVNPNIIDSATEESTRAQATLASSHAWGLMDEAMERQGGTFGTLRKKLGAEGVDFYDAVRNYQAQGLSREQAVVKYNKLLGQTGYRERINMKSVRRDIETALKADTSTGTTVSTVISNSLKDTFPERVHVDPALEEDFLQDVHRAFARNGQQITKETAKAALEETSKKWGNFYAAARSQDGDMYLVHRERLAPAQRRIFDPVVDQNGKSRVGSLEVDERIAQITGDYSAWYAFTTGTETLFGGNLGQSMYAAPFLKTMFLDGGHLANFTDKTSQAQGTIPLANSTDQPILVHPGIQIEFKAFVDIHSLPVTERQAALKARDDNPRRTLNITGDYVGQAVTDGDVTQRELAPWLSDEEAINVIKEGGTISMGQFVDTFNRVFEPVHGMKWVERMDGVQKVFTLEYNGTVPTAEEIEAHRIHSEENYQRPLSMAEKFSMGMYNIHHPNMEPEFARNLLAEAKGGLQKDIESTRQQWRDFPNSLWGSSKIREAEKIKEKNAQKLESDERVNLLTGAVSEAQDQGQVRPSVGLTVLGMIPAEINSTEQMISIYQKLLKAEGQRKGGLPNEREDTPLDDTYAKLRQDLIYAGEGVRKYAYMDTSGVPTIGVGFNLTDPVVKKTVTAMVGEADYKQMLKDATVRSGDLTKKVSLTAEQMNVVFETVIMDKEASVTKWYAGTDLTPVQRAVIVDLAYQGGSRFVGPNTNFNRAVKERDWDTAINEVRNRSNKNNVQGIQNRMDHRSDMLQLSMNGSITTDAASTGEPSVLDKVINSVTSLSVVGSAQASTRLDKYIQPESDQPATVKDIADTSSWVKSVWQKAGSMKDEMLAAAEMLGIEVASVAAQAITPSDSSGMLFSDYIVKNTMGIPLDRKEYTGADLKPRNVRVLQQLARSAMAAGRMNITWADYGNASDGIPIGGIIGHKGHEKASKAYPRNAFGFAKLGLLTVIDPKVDMAMVIGQASLTIDKKTGNVFLTDVYDIQRFKHGSRSTGIYGAVRDGIEGKVTSESGSAAKPIRWRINLGKIRG